MKITKLETFLIAPRWLFLRVHTDEGIVGLGEPYLEGRATTSAEAVRELGRLPHRSRSTTNYPSLGGDVSTAMLSWWRNYDERDQWGRGCALGYPR